MHVSGKAAHITNKCNTTIITAPPCLISCPDERLWPKN